jgi:hypothetical protein
MADHRVHEKSRKIREWLRLHKLPKPIRVLVVGIVGGICLIGGIIMIFTPGPAVVFIPLGVLLLASEFKFAERFAIRMLDAFDAVRQKWQTRKSRRSAQPKL